MSLFGTIIAISYSTVPTGYLLCNGSAVSRITYSALFSAIGTLYGEGDGSSTFNLPDLVNKFIQGCAGKEYVGTNRSPGLPNATGLINFYGSSGFSASGAFSIRGRNAYSLAMEVGTNIASGSYEFNLSAATGSIYGMSDTVQPPATLLRFCIKY